MGEVNGLSLILTDSYVVRGTGCEDVDWVHVSQVGNLWQALVKTVMNLRIP